MTRSKGKTPAQASNGQKSHSRDFAIAGIGLAGGLLGAIIGLVATMLATSSTNSDQTSLQVREMKQSQYAATYKAIDLEITSMGNALEFLQREDVSDARKEVESYKGTDQVVEELAALPLVANAQVLSAGIGYLENREKFITAIYSAALAFDSKQSGRLAKVGVAEKKLAALRNSEGDLLAAMRLDLNIPSGS